jgi:hypothetical protein
MAQSAALKQMQSPSLVSYPPDYFFSSTSQDNLKERNESKHHQIQARNMTSFVKNDVSGRTADVTSCEYSRQIAPRNSPSDGEKSASEDDMDEFNALEPLEEDSLSEGCHDESELHTPAKKGIEERGIRTNLKQAEATTIERNGTTSKNSSARRRRLLSFARSPWPVADGWEVHLTPTHGPSASRHGTMSGRRRAARSGLHGIGENVEENTPSGLSSRDGIRTQLARLMLPSPSPTMAGASPEGA